MRLVDLFAGVGGFRVGLATFGAKSVLVCESDPQALACYRLNEGCGTGVVSDDVRGLEELPECDVLTAGFPCQPFSHLAEYRAARGEAIGVDEVRGTLFGEVVRLLATRRPPVFLLENVAYLRSLHGGRSFATIMEALRGLGYAHLEERVIGADWCVPQIRRRVFIVGVRDRVEGYSLHDLVVPVSERMPVMADVLHPEDGSEVVEEPYTSGELGMVGDWYVLSLKNWGRYMRAAKASQQYGNGYGYAFVYPDQNTTALLSGQPRSPLVLRVGGLPRRLTERETARVMGFGDGWVMPSSYTATWRQLGNAVVPGVVELIGQHLMECGVWGD